MIICDWSPGTVMHSCCCRKVLSSAQPKNDLEKDWSNSPLVLLSNWITCTLKTPGGRCSYAATKLLSCCRCWGIGEILAALFWHDSTTWATITTPNDPWAHDLVESGNKCPKRRTNWWLYHCSRGWNLVEGKSASLEHHAKIFVHSTAFYVDHGPETLGPGAGSSSWAELAPLGSPTQDEIQTGDLGCQDLKKFPVWFRRLNGEPSGELIVSWSESWGWTRLN